MIPDFQTIMLPFLEELSDGETKELKNIREQLALKFEVSEEERAMLLPSGTQSIFVNRVAWASVYLKRAGLIQSPKRAWFTISDDGRKVLSKRPSRIDIPYLRKFPKFLNFITAEQPLNLSGNNLTEAQVKTPEELLADNFQTMKRALADELLNKVLELPPAFFERLVVELLVKMGYGGSIKDAGMAVGQSNDGGIDGIIKEDKLGLDVIYIQAKRLRDNSIGRPVVQGFVGALESKRGNKGVFITTSAFTNEARRYVTEISKRVVLIDGNELAELMIDYGLGCNTHQVYEVKKIDSDYFGEE